MQHERKRERRDGRPTGCKDTRLLDRRSGRLNHLAKTGNQFRGRTLVRGNTGEVASEKNEGSPQVGFQEGTIGDPVGMLDKSRDTAKFTTRELLQRLEAVAHPDVFVGSSLLSPETPGGRVLHDDEAGTDDLLDKKLVQGKVGGEELERAVSVGGCFNELVRHSLLSLPVVQYIKSGPVHR